jgi:hypothetical protein
MDELPAILRMHLQKRIRAVKLFVIANEAIAKYCISITKLKFLSMYENDRNQ